MRCGEGIELSTSSEMWAAWAEEEYLTTHHARRKFNFHRLLYIIAIYLTQIHRVRVVCVNKEASRVKPSKKKNLNKVLTKKMLKT